ncbi:MAG TPA: hypothetical protein PLL17_08215 [Defluviitaleaceae bacterium]|nr:hypothetical protein [Candidatus Epulonipiscium sp.]HOQ15960.1 hypothetical protein [Defluviitaleaceae bacterium]HPT76654.1 hypothetical protein [Defluviitaleaceae bacterium]HQD51093.1 hypothetical protein [Defluviitaleaceae bacterium]
MILSFSEEVDLAGNVINLRLKNFGHPEFNEKGEKFFNFQAEGEWIFEIPLDYPAYKADSAIDRVLEVKGNPSTIMNLSLTPIRLNVEFLFPYTEDPDGKYSCLFDDFENCYLITEDGEKLYVIKAFHLQRSGMMN